MEHIESKDNKKVKLLRSLSIKKNRDKTGLFIVEGKRMTDEALEYAASLTEFVFVSGTYAEANSFGAIENMKIPICVLSDSLFRQISDTVNPQGIGAVLRQPETPDISTNGSHSRILVLDGVSEPGNLGTIVRTAEAAGIEAICMLKGCADVYNPKVVRATMGSIFRVPIISGCGYESVAALKEKGFSVIASALSGSVSVYEYAQMNKENTKRAIVIGSEAFGVSDEILKLADTRVRIPMQGRVESLNAAVAAGILMYIL